MPQTVIIIGAGISGLSVGSYLQMNGFATEIFEMHDQPGGLCTAWDRKGYTFDSCIHWLIGSSPGTNMHEMWRELHALEGTGVVEWDEYARVRVSSGETFTVFTDPTRLEQEMLRLAPEDGEPIRALCDAIRAFSRLDMPVTTEKLRPLELAGMSLRFALKMPVLRKWGSVNLETFCAGLKCRALGEALGALYGSEGSMPDLPMTALVMMLAFMHKKSNGYPLGGSRRFARAIEARYVGLGGRIHYRSRVDRILVENDRAVGIFAGGQEHRAEEVISCADGHATIFEMLEGRYLNPRIREAYESYSLFPSLIYVGLGIGKDMRDIPSMQYFPLSRPIILEQGARRLNRLGVRLFSFDPTMAPAGKTAAVVSIDTRNFTYWSTLRAESPGDYRREKIRIGEAVVEAVDEELGDIRRFVEVVDVATPATWHRYTGNWKGSYEGFLPTRTTMMKDLPSALPGLANFSMHGQWVTVGGGLPPAAMGGRTLAKALCKKYGKRFVAST